MGDDDDDVDLFGSSDEEESEEKKRITEERLKAYHEKKSKKAAVIAKTSVLLDVKPWDDETDMDKMLENVKSIEQDGLLWGTVREDRGVRGLRPVLRCQCHEQDLEQDQAVVLLQVSNILEWSPN